MQHSPLPRDPVTGHELPLHLIDDAPEVPQPALPLSAALIAVALGAAGGAWARWLLGLALPARPLLVTAAINLAGCAAMGLLMAVLARLGSQATQARWHLLLRPALATGVLGGFTTFSTFAVDVVGLVDQGRWLAAGGYLAGTSLGGVLAVWVGQTMGRGAGVWGSRHRKGLHP